MTPRTLYLALLAAGAAAGLLVAVFPPGTGSCPPPREGRVLCEVSHVWLRGITALAGGLFAGHALGGLLAYRLPRLRRRWAAGERLRFQTPAQARARRAPEATGLRLSAATWSHVTAPPGPRRRAAELGWLAAGPRELPSPREEEPAPETPPHSSGAGSPPVCLRCLVEVPAASTGERCPICDHPLLVRRRITGAQRESALARP